MIGDHMPMFDNAVSHSKETLPEISIKYKDQSWLMYVASKLLFFNKDFMDFTTTLGSTIYFPSEGKVKLSPVSFTVIYLHELSHIYQAKKNKIWFFSSYLFPQILALLSIPAFFLFGLIPALLCLLFLLPLPAYFRMKEEEKAYIISLYVLNKLNNTNNFHINLDDYKAQFVGEFLGSDYYWMWRFPTSVQARFDEALDQIILNNQPYYEKELYELIDKCLI